LCLSDLPADGRFGRIDDLARRASAVQTGTDLASGPAERRHHDRATRSRKEGPLSEYVLKLYVTGNTPKAQAAISNLRRICDEELGGKYELQIIDVLEHPQVAEDDRILATPTLIKRLPPPLRRVIGDLSDKHKVLLGLEVLPDASTSNPDRRP
jgi:circadian clock protein KaiB